MAWAEALACAAIAGFAVDARARVADGPADKRLAPPPPNRRPALSCSASLVLASMVAGLGVLGAEARAGLHATRSSTQLIARVLHRRRAAFRRCTPGCCCSKGLLLAVHGARSPRSGDRIRTSLRLAEGADGRRGDGRGVAAPWLHLLQAASARRRVLRRACVSSPAPCAGTCTTPTSTPRDPTSRWRRSSAPRWPGASAARREPHGRRASRVALGLSRASSLADWQSAPPTRRA